MTALRLGQLGRILGFFTLTLGVLGLALSASSRVRFGEYTLLQGFARNYIEPGGRFHSLQRFREASQRGHVDVVFLGASHTYRGFDPRLFAAEGIATMNLGSTNQTPLNGYYVAERFLPKLSPRVLVIEVSYNTLSTDGLEAFRDLAVNTSWSTATQRMALATWNLGAMTFATAKGFGLTADESKVSQQEIVGERYIDGGYVETEGRRTALLTDEAGTFSFDTRPRQLEYLAATTELGASLGARVVWVTLPVPRDYASRMNDRRQLAATIEAAARRANVPYWDFSDSLDLDPLAEFKDVLHLNAAGVAKFDRAFIERLVASGCLR